MSNQEKLFFNGINAGTGNYLFEPLVADNIINKAQSGNNEEGNHLKTLEERFMTGISTKGVRSKVKDPSDLSQTGWAIIFADGDKETEAIKDALQPLLTWRQSQAAAKNETYYQEYYYKPGESKTEFLQRYGAEPYGAADPDNMPYYLLLVGNPAQISYRFQYQLDVQYAVGRLCFNTITEYAQYAQNVVQAEKEGGLSLARQATFFGVRNPDDRATHLSADNLIKPIAKSIADYSPDWQIKTLLAEEATKAQLTTLLGGDQTPSLLFTASHGIGFPNGDERQFKHQGALLCQDWPGPVAWGNNPIPPDYYFSADDVSKQAQMLGLLSFHFGCYTAGTPQQDEFFHLNPLKQPSFIAPQAFVARLPQQLLLQGALAVVGHVERAWGYSFSWQNKKQTSVFEDVLFELMDGYPVGRVMEHFSNRYAEYATTLSSEYYQAMQEGHHIDDQHRFLRLWTANNDARSYVIIGDPAARLCLNQNRSVMRHTRPEINLIPVESVADEPPQPAEHLSDKKAKTGESDDAQSFFLGMGKKKQDTATTDSENETLSGLKKSLQTLTTTLTEAITRFASDVSSLEVKTYVSDDLDNLKFENGDFVGSEKPSLRALTYIDFDGDMKIVVPEDDAELWEIHLEMVRQAQANRAEMFKAAMEAAASLINLTN